MWVLALMLIAFGIFAVGFLIGYKRENKKILKNNLYKSNNEKEEKQKKKWKEFLEYDGSLNDSNIEIWFIAAIIMDKKHNYISLMIVL